MKSTDKRYVLFISCAALLALAVWFALWCGSARYAVLPMLYASLTAALFGLGLLLAGMANPSKVLAFLDLTGAWDPSLALVMVGAIGIAVGPLTWARQQSSSLLGRPMQLPIKRELDPRLIGGSLLFGIGWGIAGICPGPAVAILLTGSWQVIVFMLAMLAGMLLFTALETRRSH